MSASWLITDGFSGMPSGVSKIVTMGLYSDQSTPPASAARPVNWLSPSPSMFAFLFAAWMGFKWLP